MYRESAKSLAVKILSPNSPALVTIFMPPAATWEIVKKNLEEGFQKNPHHNYNSHEIVKSVCSENGWSWREGIANTPDILVFAG